MTDTTFVYFADRSKWRAWLTKNHKKEREVWLLYYKIHSGRKTLSYDDAVEEALCFGWIDSLVRKVDDEKYMQKFSPRTRGSNWSVSNKRRIQQLLEQGLMTESGLATIDYDIDGSIEDLDRQVASESASSKKRDLTEKVPLFRSLLNKHRNAQKNFDSLAPSYQREYVDWYYSAKKEDTRNRRLTEAIALLQVNKKLGMK